MKMFKSALISSKTVLVILFVLIAVMASQSMNAADSTEKKIVAPKTIRTTFYNHFTTSSHYKNW